VLALEVIEHVPPAERGGSARRWRGWCGRGGT
jgi:hypothetical protein